MNEEGHDNDDVDDSGNGRRLAEQRGRCCHDDDKTSLLLSASDNQRTNRPRGVARSAAHLGVRRDICLDVTNDCNSATATRKTTANIT